MGNLSFASIFFLEERKRGREEEKEKKRKRGREEVKERKRASEREKEIDRARDIFASKVGSFLEETQRSS